MQEVSADGGRALAAGMTRARIRRALLAAPSAPGEDMAWLRGATSDVQARVRAAMPERCVHAAVLVPLIERESVWTVLLTRRSAALKDHAGQISFPGGRIETLDADARAAAWREAEEEIGLAADALEFAGYLPDHLILTGYRVTPVVAFVGADPVLELDRGEVDEAFEAPLEFLFDGANHRTRMRRVGDLTLEMIDVPYGEHNIWGATAAMLMSLRAMLIASDANAGRRSETQPAEPGPVLPRPAESR
jgi:8-oxo-dGTP pyrophosphatase MutT (NUDIX family)